MMCSYRLESKIHSNRNPNTINFFLEEHIGMLQDRLNKIKEFFQSIEQYEGKWVICVKYRSKWGAYPSEDGKIKAVPDEHTPDVWWYYANDSKVDIDSIFDLIDETIQTNLDAVRKVELFKLKADELKRIFSDETMPFSKLQTLEFTFSDTESEKDEKPKKTKTPKKTRPMTKKDILKIDDSVSDVSVENMTEKKTDDKKVEKTPSDSKDGTAVNANELTQEEIDNLRG